MKYNIRKNWIETFAVMTGKPIIILPFFIIAFFEALALELVYFSARSPIALVTNPIVRKFFGEQFLHYPANLVLLPRIFYYLQVAIYILLGVFLTAVSINIYKNIKENLPVRTDAMVKNAAKRYISFFIYAVIVIILIILLRKADTFIFAKGARLISKLLPQIPAPLYTLAFTLFSFLTNVIIEVFVVLAVPLIVIEKLSLLKALGRSILTGARRFFTIFALIFLPFLVYLPLTLVKSFSTELVVKTSPEMNFYVSLLGIIVAAFLDCFIIISVSKFVMDSKEGHKVTRSQGHI